MAPIQEEMIIQKTPKKERYTLVQTVTFNQLYKNKVKNRIPDTFITWRKVILM
jgi:hypothetical protein